ncbi:hypothetical protein B0H14DRAFT_2603351 [Mycena olivaceomarginata]|nr:hypothetical protein B0H14DRAFT_2603351 [Mycena olivaceomarginata]
MAPSKKAAKAKKLVQAKKAKKKDATRPPKKKAKAEEPRLTLKLRLLGPKAPEVSTPEPTPRPEPVDLISSPDPTPPRNPSQEEVSAAVGWYWLSKGRLSPALEEDELDDSETEALLVRKGTVYGEELEESADEGRETQGSASPESGSGSQKSVEDELESDDNEPFDLKLSVPFAGANSTVTVSSTITFKDLLLTLADTMSLPPKSVRVAYRFTTQPRTTAFTHLSNDIELEDMVTAVHAAQLTTRSTKEFKVELKDLAAITKGKGNTDGKKESKKKKHVSPIISTEKPRADTNLLQKRGESDSEESEGDGEGDEVDGKKVKSKTKSLPHQEKPPRKNSAIFAQNTFGPLKF